MMREINAAGLELIKSFESCRLNSYQDQKGIWTIGYGHSAKIDPCVVEGMTITQEQAEAYLKKDLEIFHQLDHYLSEQVNENQYSALICLAFNVGLGAVKRSTLLRDINEGNYDDMVTQWKTWDHVDGVENDGLRRRRLAELKLYNMVG
jgi:lysozyme